MSTLAGFGVGIQTLYGGQTTRFIQDVEKLAHQESGRTQDGVINREDLIDAAKSTQNKDKKALFLQLAANSDLFNQIDRQGVTDGYLNDQEVLGALDTNFEAYRDKSRTFKLRQDELEAVYGPKSATQQFVNDIENIAQRVNGDHDQNGSLTKSELRDALQALRDSRKPADQAKASLIIPLLNNDDQFGALDQNKSGGLSAREINAGFQGLNSMS